MVWGGIAAGGAYANGEALVGGTIPWVGVTPLIPMGDVGATMPVGTVGRGPVPAAVLARLGLQDGFAWPALCCHTAGDTIERASTAAGGGETKGAEFTKLAGRL